MSGGTRYELLRLRCQIRAPVQFAEDCESNVPTCLYATTAMFFSSAFDQTRHSNATTQCLSSGSRSRMPCNATQSPYVLL